MSKLYLKYGAMSSGKTETLLNIIYDYERKGFKVAVVKPMIDTKGEMMLYSRSGRKRAVDVLLDPEKHTIDQIKEFENSGDEMLSVVVVDEAQFLTPKQVQELHLFAHVGHAPVIALGIKVDVYGNPFEGMSQLFAMADRIEEIGTRTLCQCGKRATMHLRIIDTEVDLGGSSQVIIDDPEACDGMVQYVSVCSHCWLVAGFAGVVASNG